MADTARLVRAWQGGAGTGKADVERRGLQWRGKVGMVRRGNAGYGRRGMAKLGQSRFGASRLGEVGMARQSTADEASQGRGWRGMALQTWNGA